MDIKSSYTENQGKSYLIENMNWIRAEEIIKENEVVLIALGARTKEHGPHLLLKNDYLMAEHLRNRVCEHISVIILPTLQYGHYPAFLEYPGSVSLKSETFQNVIIDICESMHGYGIKKFYILNTGVSTLEPLRLASVKLQTKGIILRYSNLLEIDDRLPNNLLSQEGGTHADEGETSFMLYISPETVNMKKAVEDYDHRPNLHGLSRTFSKSSHYSPTGIWGNPTLATKEKGKLIEEEMIRVIVKEIQTLISLKL